VLADGGEDGATAADGDFALTVTAVNDAPVVAQAPPAQSVAEDTPWSYQLPAGTFVDVDSSLTLTATLADGSALPAWMTFNATTGTFSGTPPQDWNGALSIKVTASDGTLSADAIFALTVTAVNDAPVVAV
ncbi:cadherin-like domain-containing protein, partial [Corallococcus exiguus]|uniref:putative Ig domain-containing protein n=1 Tax=Corallococcus exiguus TaxID=83462 RepID=UPI00147335AF